MIRCGITGSSGVLGKKIKKILPYKFIEFKKDITNSNEVKKWVDKYDFDIFIHLAAVVPARRVSRDFKKAHNVNVKGTINLINSIINKKNKPKWFFFSSTSHVYKLNYTSKKTSEKEIPRPQTKYGKTKFMAENYLRKKLKKTKINLCIGRIFSFTDKKQKSTFVIPSITKKIKLAIKSVTLHKLNHYRDFLNTKDIALAINSLRKIKAKGIYNIGTGHQFHLKEIAVVISKKFNKKVNFIDSRRTTFLIADNKKILGINWKPKKIVIDLNYFY